MLIFNNTKFSIYFGDSKTSPFTGQEFLLLIEHYKEQLQEKLNVKTCTLDKGIMANSFLFLRQVHGTDGILINNFTNRSSLSKDGDYLITNLKNLGIGVLTADCLPIIFYDEMHSTTAIAHAGWPGSINCISQKVINDMQKTFNTKTNDLKIFFGPSAKACCYEVSSDFISRLDKKTIDQVISYKDNKIFF